MAPTIVKPSRVFCFVVILILVLLGGAIRLVIASHDWLWLDELHTAWVVGDTLSAVSPRAIIGNQSPLFFWLVWGVTQWFSDSVLGLRLVSLMAGLLLIFAATHLTWTWTRSLLATTMTGWLIAVDPQFIFYATEARPYVLVQLLSVMQVLCFWKLLSRFHVANRVPSFSWIAVGTLTAAISATMIYCHYTSIWLLGAELVFVTGYGVALKLKKITPFQWSQALITMLAVIAVTALLCVPAMLHLNEVFQRRGNWNSVSSAPMLVREMRWPLMLWIVLPLICTAILSPNKQERDAKSFAGKPTELAVTQLVFVLLWVLVPIACVLLLDHFHIAPLALSRYTLVGSAAIPIFCGRCIGASGKWPVPLAMAGVLFGVSLYQTSQSPMFQQWIATGAVPNFRLENWRDPIREINAREDKATHPVFLFANVIEDIHAFTTDDAGFQQYLLFPVSGIETIDLTRREAIAAPTLSGQHFRPADIELMKARGGGWVIVRSEMSTVGNPRGLLAEISRDFHTLAAAMKEPDQQQPAAEPTAMTKTHDSGEPQVRFLEFPVSNIQLISIDWK